MYKRQPGVGLARGEYVMLLNDDIEIIQEDWLEKMMRKAVLPHVGAVGVKLFYPGSHTTVSYTHLDCIR